MIVFIEKERLKQNLVVCWYPSCSDLSNVPYKSYYPTKLFRHCYNTKLIVAIWVKPFPVERNVNVSFWTGLLKIMETTVCHAVRIIHGIKQFLYLTVFTSFTESSKVKGKRKHPCRFCPKVCNSSCAVKEHERTHTGEKPYQCEVCGKAFSHRSARSIHMTTHGYPGMFTSLMIASMVLFLNFICNCWPERNKLHI